MKSTKKLALTGVLSAIAVALLLIACLLPTLSYTVAVIAGFAVAVAYLECGLRYALLCYTSSSILAVLLAPDKSVAFVYVFLFGLYPIVKSFAESRRSKLGEYSFKMLFCNAMLVALYFMVKLFATLPTVPDFPFIWLIVLLICNAVFLLYDYVFSGLITIYRHYTRKKK